MFNNDVSALLQDIQDQHSVLRREENLPVRLAIIGGLGSLGLLLARRGGRVRRLVYTGLGSGLGTLGCYPGEVRQSVDGIRTGQLPTMSSASLPRFDSTQVSRSAEYLSAAFSDVLSAVSEAGKTVSQTIESQTKVP